jgi:hypothetical protein
LALTKPCLATGVLPPGETSFAHPVSHPVTPLPDAGIGPWAIIDASHKSQDESDDVPVVVPTSTPLPMSRASVCGAVASAARANDLPVPFFANLIWHESNFNSRAVSPAGAQGIAQFMPATAKEYGLNNPFDPIHALNAAGRFLNKLVAQFGNLGLAAAAYNAGPGRVNDFMSRRRQLPGETKNYVVRITGRPAEKWASAAFARAPAAKLMPAKAPCIEVVQAVAAQAKAVQTAELNGPAAASKARPIRAARTIKGKAVAVAGSIKKTTRTPVKNADRIAPEKTMAKQVKSGGKLAAAKARIAKSKTAGAPSSRTRVATAN